MNLQLNYETENVERWNASACMNTTYNCRNMKDLEEWDKIKIKTPQLNCLQKEAQQQFMSCYLFLNSFLHT
ncbi:hypothetical protein DICVIV_12647 [Dictyocaulus viviparus]|uniref:Uncharacterized protein n=1 Tax=Dictyocaulus viviparus TaxID=29172 RepID=A0A0D8X9Y8_DICVI|nr:hypothetical protein DICVIV_12647 [Dictyocaulus viviparus]